MIVNVDGLQETAAFTYRYRRGMRRNVDMATVLVADLNGAATQKYAPDSKLYKAVSIKDPDGTKVFDGRIKNIAKSGAFVVLDCEGWIAQLNDIHIASYDTKELLRSGSATRQGTIGSVSGTQISSCTVDGVNPNWTTNQWIGYAVVFPDNLGSTPRQASEYCTASWLKTDFYNNNPFWIQSDHNKAHTKDWNDSWTDSDLQSYCVAAGTPGYMCFGLEFTASESGKTTIDLYTKWGVYNFLYLYNTAYFQLYNWNTSSWDTIFQHSANPGQNLTGIWDENSTGLSAANYCNAQGLIKFRICGPPPGMYAGPGVKATCDYCRIDVHYQAAVTKAIFPITANTSNGITSSENFQNAGIQGTDPFSIANKSSENVKILVQAYDAQKALTVTNVSATSKYPPREWKEATALDIISDLAGGDDCDFWADLSQNFYYNRSPPTPTKHLDSDDIFLDFGVNALGSALKNEVHVWGYKYPSSTEVHEVRVNQSSKDTFGLTRTQVVRDTAIYTAIDADAKGDGILSISAFPKRQFSIVLAGKLNAHAVAIDVGDTINLNLSKYGFNENLIVITKDYDPSQNKMIYEVAYYGSAARTTLIEPLQILDDIGRQLQRLTIQAAQR